MKKSVIFLLCGLALFFFPSLSYSESSLCSENDYYCWQIEVITAVASVQSYYNTRAFTDASCSSWTGSGSTLVLAGGTYWKMRKRSRLINGTWGAWSSYYNAGTNPGVPPESTGVFILDACEDDRPDPCEIAEKDPVSDCGDIEYVTWEDVDTCEYHCNTCDDDYQAAQNQCGEGNFSFHASTCEWDCLDCDETVSVAEAACTFGWHWNNMDTCDWDCNQTCVDSFKDCLSDCYALGGILKEICQSDSDDNILARICTCRDDNEEETGSGTDPEDPVDPGDDDPADDPADPDDQAAWLEAIKGDTGTLVEQGNADAERQEQHTSLLDNISDNTKTIADNQGILDDTLQGIGDKIDNLAEIEVDLGEIDLDLTTLENNTTAIKDSLNVDDGFADSFESQLDSALESAETESTTDLETTLTTAFNDYEGVTTEDVGFLRTLYSSVIPPSVTCIPLDLSYKDNEIIVGCEYDTEIKAIMSYVIYILTIMSIYTLVRRELVPKSSPG